MGTSGHPGCPRSQYGFMTCTQTMKTIQQCAMQLGSPQFQAARHSARTNVWGPCSACTLRSFAVRNVTAQT